MLLICNTIYVIYSILKYCDTGILRLGYHITTIALVHCETLFFEQNVKAMLFKTGKHCIKIAVWTLHLVQLSAEALKYVVLVDLKDRLAFIKHGVDQYAQ